MSRHMIINNLTVRRAIESNHLYYYEIAEQLNIAPYTFSVWLRKELTPERKEKVLEAISALRDLDNEQKQKNNIQAEKL